MNQANMIANCNSGSQLRFNLSRDKFSTLYAGFCHVDIHLKHLTFYLLEIKFLKLQNGQLI